MHALALQCIIVRSCMLSRLDGTIFKQLQNFLRRWWDGRQYIYHIRRKLSRCAVTFTPAPRRIWWHHSLAVISLLQSNKIALEQLQVCLGWLWVSVVLQIFIQLQFSFGGHFAKLSWSHLHYDSIDRVLLYSLKNVVYQRDYLISVIAFKNEFIFLYRVDEQVVDIGFFVVLSTNRQHF